MTERRDSDNTIGKTKDNMTGNVLKYNEKDNNKGEEEKKDKNYDILKAGGGEGRRAEVKGRGSISSLRIQFFNGDQ